MVINRSPGHCIMKLAVRYVYVLVKTWIAGLPRFAEINPLDSYDKYKDSVLVNG